jgi:AcrR family transcriptional regulator
VSRSASAEQGSRATVTPKAVRETALTLFARVGYHGTTMNDIARELGIKKPSLYVHVRAKQDLLRDLILETEERLLAEFHEAVASTDDAREQLRRAMEAAVRRHALHPRQALVGNRDMSALDEPHRERVHELRVEHERSFRSIIERGTEQGVFDVESPRFASFALLEMAVSVARWFDPAGPASADELARQYGEFAVRLVGGVSRRRTAKRSG